MVFKKGEPVIRILLVIDYILLLPEINDTRKRMIKMKNKILAIPAAPAAMPKNPKAPATMAMIKNISVQRNIWLFFS